MLFKLINFQYKKHGEINFTDLTIQCVLTGKQYVKRVFNYDIKDFYKNTHVFLNDDEVRELEHQQQLREKGFYDKFI